MATQQGGSHASYISLCPGCSCPQSRCVRRRRRPGNEDLDVEAMLRRVRDMECNGEMPLAPELDADMTLIDKPTKFNFRSFAELKRKGSASTGAPA